MQFTFRILLLVLSTNARPADIKKDAPTSYKCNKAAKSCCVGAMVLLASGNKVDGKGLKAPSSAPGIQRMERESFLGQAALVENDIAVRRNMAPSSHSSAPSVEFDRCSWVKVLSFGLIAFI
jgi:hypothetical protein